MVDLRMRIRKRRRRRKRMSCVVYKKEVDWRI